MGLLGFLNTNKATNTTSNTVATDSYNRSFNSVRNESNSNNLNIAVGQPNADVFSPPAASVQKAALSAAAVMGIVALAFYWLRKKK